MRGDDGVNLVHKGYCAYIYEISRCSIQKYNLTKYLPHTQLYSCICSELIFQFRLNLHKERTAGHIFNLDELLWHSFILRFGHHV